MLLKTPRSFEKRKVRSGLEERALHLVSVVCGQCCGIYRCFFAIVNCHFQLIWTGDLLIRVEVQPSRAVGGGRGGDGQVRIAINGRHLSRFSFPVFDIILNNAKTINPQEPKTEESREIDDVLESPG